MSRDQPGLDQTRPDEPGATDAPDAPDVGPTDVGPTDAAATDDRGDDGSEPSAADELATLDADEAVRRHLVVESALLSGVLEAALDRAVAIDESRIDWGNPLVPPSEALEDALAIRFQQDEANWACLLPAWMLDGKTLADDAPARIVAALMPESLPFHKPRLAETAELIDEAIWTAADRPQALRLPCDGREEPIWVLLGSADERQRIGQERLHGVPVSVVVTLAEKRIEVGQLTAISPGALITFAKPCEDLLDLYVNNRKFCRGEAVKIGEKFGLKVTEIGVEHPRVSPVLQVTG